MHVSKLILSLLGLLVSVSLHAAKNEKDQIRILLIGDSTTEGGKPVFESSIEQLLTAQALPKMANWWHPAEVFLIDHHKIELK